MASDTVITYTWNQLTEDVNWLGKAVIASKFDPQEIVGIVRGGCIPGVMLSHMLRPSFTPLKWSKRDRQGRDFGKWMEIVERASDGHRILMTEDIIDSGETIREMVKVASEYYEATLWKNNLKIATLWFNTSQDVKVDYVKNIIDRNIDRRWVIFPFEV